MIRCLEPLRRLIVIARNRGVASIALWCLVDNERMCAVAAKVDASLCQQW